MAGSSVRPLRDIQVVDLTTGIAGPYCTKLFVDAGADVVKVEPLEGDPLRRYAATSAVPPGEDGALFGYLNAGKRSIVAAPGDARVDGLLAGADLLVEDLPIGTIDVEAVRERHPHLVVVSITPFGRTGPHAGRPATDLTLQAESGAIMFKGDPTRPPVQAGGRIAEFFGGLFAAPGALAAVLHSLDNGRGTHIDVSIHDVLAIAGSNYLHLMHELRGRPDVAGPARMLDTPGIETASDGMVAFNTNAGHMFQMFLLLVGRPDLMDDPACASLTTRLAMGDAWQQIIDDYVGKHTVAEILAEAEGLRVPVAPVHDGASVLRDEHLVARGVFVERDDGMVQPRRPYLIDGEDTATPGRAPRIGEHDTTVTARESHAPRSGTPTHPAPLSGLKVVDLTSWWVGALATQTLAMLGADVIHIEGVAHPDGMRLTGAPFAKTEDWWEWGHMFAAANTTKRGIAIDVGTTEGRAVLDRLIEWADVLVENFSPRVAEGWGLTRDAVLARNPRIVYQRMPAYGLTGPWRDRPAFAQTIEPMSTMASITGYPDALPLSKGGLPDPTGGMHGAWSILVSLAEARRRGAGVFCEAVMIEAALNVCAQPVLEFSAYGVGMTRTGNRSSHAAPQGVYACAGVDAWLAISVTDDEQWHALATVIGGSALAGDPRYVTHEKRRAHHDDLDEVLARWCADRDPSTAADALASAGVPAAECRSHLLIDSHPQYEARRLFAPVTHPVLGTYHTPGLPYRWDGVDRWVGDPAPTFGQHNREVLREVVGLDGDAIDALERTGVIASRPRGL